MTNDEYNLTCHQLKQLASWVKMLAPNLDEFIAEATSREYSEPYINMAKAVNYAAPELIMALAELKKK